MAPSRWSASWPPYGLGALPQEASQAAAPGVQAPLGQYLADPRLRGGRLFEHHRLPLALRQQLDQLAQGDFVDRGVNVLAFGPPGTGKTHALCALGHRLVESGRWVLFAPAYRLVQDLLAAKRDLALPRQLR